MADKITEMKHLIKWNNLRVRIDRMTAQLKEVEEAATKAGVLLVEISEEDLHELR